MQRKCKGQCFFQEKGNEYFCFGNSDNDNSRTMCLSNLPSTTQLQSSNIMEDFFQNEIPIFVSQSDIPNLKQSSDFLKETKKKGSKTEDNTKKEKVKKIERSAEKARKEDIGAKVREENMEERKEAKKKESKERNKEEMLNPRSREERIGDKKDNKNSKREDVKPERKEDKNDDKKVENKSERKEEPYKCETIVEHIPIQIEKKDRKDNIAKSSNIPLRITKNKNKATNPTEIKKSKEEQNLKVIEVDFI